MAKGPRAGRGSSGVVAAFANSPIQDEWPTGWLSSRQDVWSRMDAGRTRSPRYHPDPRVAWTRYALDRAISTGTSPRPPA
ncbi:glutamate-cysteine ligase family protein [Streptomyces sp. NPDC093228]|uniref:glutamate-cysteine ligase family protein n=1 Tax=Streptomyces sp. NPDC093228 TaxID=3155070 RepID=UPI00343E2789